MSQPRSIAVLGGGITGLTAAYYLRQALPASVPITIFEATARVGGYIETSHVNTNKHNKYDHDDKNVSSTVVFEHGPRTLRVDPKSASSVNMVDLIRRLRLAGDLIRVRNGTAAQRNRFIYFDRVLNRVPDSVVAVVSSVFTQPLFRSWRIASEVAREPFRPPDDSENDESVADFMTRRFGPLVTSRLASAVMHGIYAGDVNKLSVRSVLERAWRRDKEAGSLLVKLPWRRRVTGLSASASDEQAAIDAENLRRATAENAELLARLSDSSVISFRNGMQSVVDRLRHELNESSSVRIEYGAPVQALERVPGGVTVVTRADNGENRQTFTTVFSALPARELSNVVTSARLTELLSQIPAVSVNVVNLFYDRTNVLPVTGFGYLVPSAVPVKDENPERVLGVVFDSDTVTDEHGVNLQDARKGTKITVMLGGHYWDEAAAVPAVTDEKEAIRQATAAVARHLNRPDLALPTFAQARFHDRCIPQYVVGHAQLLNRIHDAVIDAYGSGHGLVLLGASFLGVSVPDCVYYSRCAVDRFVSGSHGHGTLTGLEPKITQ
ncbi:hypothetical protein V1514DRAFT_324396 [Lipomyces japonicus]|uniref:uncharacterized protein n=1 Tax=Lipomyces japonicus TaxID=56871 RepID=UPI0034CF89A1